ncbi:MAG: BamA/TamA family outer membrane protein [Deltaproteobacteria bacterium]|nr:BamA/TamA family outer membrane protein [Deltaproteobacteria bacterium]
MILTFLLAVCSSMGCNVQRPARVPGETDIRVVSVTIQSKTAEPLQLELGELPNRLGMRVASLIYPMRSYGVFREAEDRRRITAYWQTYGYFDVQVDEPEVRFDDAKTTAAITWKVSEGKRYRIGSVNLLHAPEDHERALMRLIPFGPGEARVDLEKFRKVRHTMGEYLRRRGYGHANIYSRAFVDRSKQEIYWYYYVDTGPRTRVGKIIVDGNARVPAELILRRIGMQPGDPYDLATKEKSEWDLLDTGDFAAVFIRSNVDVKFIVPGTAPDTGGELKDEQVDAQGNLVPRKLPSDVDLKVHVVESPRTQVRLRAGVEADPTRLDASAESRLWLRDLFGPWHHLVLEGRFGHGWLWDVDKRPDDPSGFYGEALARTIHPGLLGRLGDARMTARFFDDLYPTFHLREVTAGPGIRTALERNLFLDLDLYFRAGWQLGFGPFDNAARDAFSLASTDRSRGADAEAALTWDARDNPVEPMKGHMLALRTQLSPGGALATHRWLSVVPDARGFIPLSPSLSIGVRAAGGWVLAAGDNGVPLGPRFFGGGAYGMRGFGRHRMSPYATSCETVDPAAAPSCRDVPVGGLSLMEASLEARFLPPLKPIGAITFVDVGGASIKSNPLHEGTNLAFGLGFRLRLWYLPMAIDVAYRLLDHGTTQKPGSWDPYLLFFRIGEAF